MGGRGEEQVIPWVGPPRAGLCKEPSVPPTAQGRTSEDDRAFAYSRATQYAPQKREPSAISSGELDHSELVPEMEIAGGLHLRAALESLGSRPAPWVQSTSFCPQGLEALRVRLLPSDPVGGASGPGSFCSKEQTDHGVKSRCLGRESRTWPEHF